jgi:SAM-dependent methyltransferase
MGLEVGTLTVGVRSGLAEDLERADARISAISFLPHLIASGGLHAQASRRLPEVTSEYREAVEERYRLKSSGVLARVPCFQHADNQAFAAEILAGKVVPAGAMIADIGTGTSVYARSVARVARGTALCLDLSQLALSRAWGCAGERHTEGSYLPICGDAAKLPLASSSFHLVICSETLEHVIDDHAVLSELRRILVPGGYLVVSVPTAAEHALPCFRRLLGKFNLAGHVREYPGSSLMKLLTGAGFQVEDVRGSSYFAFWILMSIERSAAAIAIQRALEKGHLLRNCLTRMIGLLLRLENRILGSRSVFGLRVHVFARKV